MNDHPRTTRVEPFGLYERGRRPMKKLIVYIWRASRKTKQRAEVLKPLHFARRGSDRPVPYRGAEWLVYLPFDSIRRETRFVADKSEYVRLAFPPTAGQDGFVFRNSKQKLAGSKGKSRQLRYLWRQSSRRLPCVGQSASRIPHRPMELWLGEELLPAIRTRRRDQYFGHDQIAFGVAAFFASLAAFIAL